MSHHYSISFGSSSFSLSSVPLKDKLTDLKLVIEDTIDNVATLQDCGVAHSHSVQLLGQDRARQTV